MRHFQESKAVLGKKLATNILSLSSLKTKKYNNLLWVTAKFVSPQTWMEWRCLRTALSSWHGAIKGLVSSQALNSTRLRVATHERVIWSAAADLIHLSARRDAACDLSSRSQCRTWQHNGPSTTSIEAITTWAWHTLLNGREWRSFCF